MLSVFVHICALAALGYAVRIGRGEDHPEPVPVTDDPNGLPRLSIVVPARNESANIERCVRSLLAQRLTDFEVLVVDDRSSDGTLEILRRLAQENPRLQVIDGAPLPEGWVGKPWALHQGALRAGGAWLLFTDADSVHDPLAEPSVLRYALDEGVDAVSLATGQELESFWERAVLPAGFAIIMLAFGPLSAINDPAAPNALANGQYILVSRKAYEALGGHAALRGEIAEDIEFAKLLKRDGRFRLRLANGTRLVRVRMYRSFRGLWEGFTKNTFIGAEGRVGTALFSAAALAMLSVVPPGLALVAMLRGRRAAAVEALCCTFAIACTTSRVYARLAIPRRYAVYQPLGFAVMGAIILNATVRVLSGLGVEWRGRRYTGRYKSERP